MLQIALLLAYLVYTLANTYIDKLEISKSSVNHTVEYAIFLGVCVASTYGVVYLFHAHMPLWEPIVIATLGSTVVRGAFFNFVLNEERNLALTYQSPTTGSLTDQIELWIASKLPFPFYIWYINVFFILVFITALFVHII